MNLLGFSNRIDITPASANTPTTVTLPASLDGATGAIVMFDVISFGRQGVRPTGNTANFERLLNGTTSTAYVRVDANRQFEVQVQGSTKAFVVGTFGSEAVFYDAEYTSKNITPPDDDNWTSTDLSSFIGTDDPVAAIVMITTTDAASAGPLGFRDSGSTNTATSFLPSALAQFFLVPVTNGICELLRGTGDTSVTFYLVGHVNSGLTKQVSELTYDVGSGSFTAVDTTANIPASHDIAIPRFTSSFGTTCALREIGDTYAWQNGQEFFQRPLLLDGSNQFEAFSGNDALDVTVDFWATNDSGSSLSITNIDTDDTVFPGQSNVVIQMSGDIGVTTGTVSIRTSGSEVQTSQAISNWNDVAETITLTSISQGHLPYANDLVLVVTPDGGSPVELTMGLVPDTASGYNSVSLVNPITDDESSAAYQTTPEAATGDQLEWNDLNGLGNVTFGVDALLTNSNTTGQIEIRFWDATDLTWGAWITVNLTELSQVVPVVFGLFRDLTSELSQTFLQEIFR